MAKKKFRLREVPAIGLPAISGKCIREMREFTASTAETNGCVGYAVIALHPDGGVDMQWNNEYNKSAHYTLLGSLQQLAHEMMLDTEDVLDLTEAD